jgi:hypothetical protein
MFMFVYMYMLIIYIHMCMSLMNMFLYNFTLHVFKYYVHYSCGRDIKNRHIRHTNKSQDR